MRKATITLVYTSMLMLSLGSCKDKKDETQTDAGSSDDADAQDDAQDDDQEPLNDQKQAIRDYVQDCGILIPGKQAERFTDGISECEALCYNNHSCDAASVIICGSVSEPLPEAIRTAIVSCLDTCQTESLFTCGDGTSVASGVQCDTDRDCPDGSDEASCEDVDHIYVCDDGQTVFAEYVCDDEADCEDGSDEVSCQTNAYRFICGDDTGLDIDAKCNGESDCADGSDELGCTSSETAFQCGDGTYVPYHFECDDFEDCENGSDEAGCATLDCPTQELELPEDL